MYWGHSLLALKVVEGIENLVSRLAYELLRILPGIFYAIWRLLGWIVSAIEKIFRNLAGLGEKGDIVSDIVGNTKVGQIFKNMVGLATALIIFFTIVKIIQDHYKEKDGGNPYKIVIRTFKGLLMFFFINAAVVVGLYASGVMFRALDAATGTGTTSIAGMAFKAMASEANRKVLGRSSNSWLSNVENEYWSRMDNPSSDDGRYFVAGFTDDNNVSPQALQARYEEAFPVTQYGIVTSDGSVTPITKWVQTADWKEKMADLGYNVDNQLQAPGQINGFKDGNANGSVSVGYKSDLLRGFDLCVTPSIDLAWSPIDIDIYSYRLEGTRLQDTAVKVSVMGNSTEIPMALQWQQFMPGQKTSKSLEDSAKQFGITLKGKVALQDSTASASFSLNAGSEFSKKFEMILMSVLLNVAYTNTVNQVIQLIPEFPVVAAVGPTSINMIQVLSPLIETTLNESVNVVFSPLVPKNEDGEPCVEVFSGTPISHNGGIWCVMNFKSSTVDTTIEQYRIDGNFKDLWGQLMGNIDIFKKQLETLNTTAMAKAAQGTQKILNAANRTSEQRDWQGYMGTVNEYNKQAAARLQKLGNLLYLYDAAVAAIPGDDNFTNGTARSNWIQGEVNGGYNGDWDYLKSEIQTNFTEMVSMYDSMINGKRPVSNYADVIITRPVYKPIIEFGLTEQNASHSTVEEIKNFFNKKVARINLLMDTSGTGVDGAYRVVDWGDSYGYMYLDSNGAGLRNVADIYYKYQTKHNAETGLDERVEPENASLVNTLGELRYLNLQQTRDENNIARWDMNGGVRYFAQKGFSINYGRSTPMTMKDNSYWGTDGVYVDGVKKYMYYEGTTYRPFKEAFDDMTLSDDDDYGDPVWNTSTRLSTAALNEKVQTAQVKQQQMIEDLTTVDKTTPLAQEFAKEIVTFRKLNTSAKDYEPADAPAKKSWVSMIDQIKSYGTPHQLKMLHAMSADEVDDYMAGTSSSERRYLLMTHEGDVNDAQADSSNWGGYIGQFSWQDYSAVRVLYDVQDMNFPVGYIAIVAALGVYMNFAFALIQRAVNMAVLYMLSPITIAFYPFDDGSKFNSVFVKPFYNEAISAFAVIVSLNIFVVLMQPLETAVANVAGVGISWIALVAFVSMLPQIRNTVYSILGGSKMSEKSLSDTFKDARNTMGKSFSDFKNAAKTTAHGMDAVRKGINSQIAKAPARKQAEIERMERYKAEHGGKLPWWMEKRYNKLTGGAKSQAGIDQARENIANGMSKDEAYKNLSKSQIRRLERQDKAAERQAKADAKRAGIAGGTKAFDDAVAAGKKKYLASDSFKKSVNGVVAGKLKGTKLGTAMGKVGDFHRENKKLFAENARGAIQGLKAASHWGPIEALRAAGGAVSNSVVGEMVKAKWGKYGTKAGDKDSLVGAIWRAANIEENIKEQTAAGIKYREQIKKKTDAAKNVLEGVDKGIKSVEKGDELYREVAKRAGAEKAIANAQLTEEEKLTRLLTTKYKKQGLTEQKAREEAEKEVAASVAGRRGAARNNLINSMYKTAGGDAKFAAGVAKGWTELCTGLNMKDTSVIEAMKTEEKRLRSLSKTKIATELVNAKESRSTAVDQATQDLMNGFSLTDENSKKTIGDILLKANVNTTFEDLSSKIQSQLNLDANQVQAVLSTVYPDFAEKVQFNGQLEAWQSTQDAAGLIAAGKEAFKSKIGPGVDQAEMDELFEAFYNAYDTNVNSVNEKSFGYQKQKIIDKYVNNGGEANPECQAEIIRLNQEYDAKAESILYEFTDRNRRTMLQSDQAKKTAQEIQASYMTQLFEPIQHEREIIMGKMDLYSHDVLIRDPKFQQMYKDGDIAGAAENLQELITAIKQHNTPKIKELGFGDKLVETYTKWDEEGDPGRRLEYTMDFAKFDASHMNFADASMGGSSLDGMKRSFAEFNRMAFMKSIADKMKIAANDAGSKEAHARTLVDNYTDNFKYDFGGNEWIELYPYIQDSAGGTVRSANDFVKALKDTVAAIADGKPMEAWMINNTEAFTNFRSKYVHKPEFKPLLDKVDIFQQAVNQAQYADRQSVDANAFNANVSEWTTAIEDILKNQVKDERNG